MELDLVGPLGIRTFELDKVCDVHVGHQHNYDHTTIVISGRVSILANGRELGTFGPGEAVAIMANTHHTLKAIEAGTKYLCVFSHRDFGGIVTQEYVGNPDAYAEYDHAIDRESPRRLARA